MFEKLKINKKLLRELDYTVLFVSIIIVVFGAFNIFSATKAKSGHYYFKLQLLWLIVALVVTYLILTFDYVIIKSYTPILYWASIVLLLLNDFTKLGAVRGGARGWITIGTRAIQPSEFAKLGMVLMVAKLIDDMEGDINNPKNLMKVLIYAGIPMILIFIQPDMGMTMVYFFILLGILFGAGINMKIFTGGILSIVILIVAVWNSGLIQQYQKNRLISFLNPEQYEYDIGLQQVQSKIGIGSGGIWGKGFMKGTQTSLSFIPENHTDFIFSVVGEEWGLVGSVFLLVLYAIIIFRFIKIAKNSKDIYGTIICLGVISIFLFSILQNIGMTIGIMPITGITLPLMSYGGSSILTSFMSIALVLNVGMRKKKINF